MGRFRKSSPSSDEYFADKHRYEHWYRDNCVYFLTSKTRDGFRAFESEEAKIIFWDRFDYYTNKYNFIPWVTTLIDNHYHSIGYLKSGENLGPMMRQLHGSVAKLVNDILPKRHLPFWRISGRQTYFDGCIRDELQARKAYRYTCIQSVRHKIVADWRTYPHTHVKIEIDRAIKRAHQLNAFLYNLPYKRYDG